MKKKRRFLKRFKKIKKIVNYYRNNAYIIFYKKKYIVVYEIDVDNEF